MRVLRVLEVTMRDGNLLVLVKKPSVKLFCFRSDYEGWKQPKYKSSASFAFIPVLEVTMRDGNTSLSIRTLLVP